MSARITNAFDIGRFEVRSFGNGWAYEVHEFDDEGQRARCFWVQDSDAERLVADCEGFTNKKNCEYVLDAYMGALGE